MGLRGILCAIQAGFFAALASVCAKIATSFDSAVYVSGLATSLCETVFDLRISLPVTQVSTTLRVMGVAGIFLCNALMWVQFTKSMHLCHSTLEATAFNTASNFFFTAFLGFFLFGENIAFQWYVGSVLLVIGLVILHKSSSERIETVDVKQGDIVSQDDSHDGIQTDVRKKES